MGSKYTVPTINLARYQELVPKDGVYITWTRVGDERFESVTNVGNRPTFGADSFAVETHLLNFSPIDLSRRAKWRFVFCCGCAMRSSSLRRGAARANRQRCEESAEIFSSAAASSAPVSSHDGITQRQRQSNFCFRARLFPKHLPQRASDAGEQGFLCGNRSTLMGSLPSTRTMVIELSTERT